MQIQALSGLPTFLLTKTKKKKKKKGGFTPVRITTSFHKFSKYIISITIFHHLRIKFTDLVKGEGGGGSSDFWFSNFHHQRMQPLQGLSQGGGGIKMYIYISKLEEDEKERRFSRAREKVFLSPG